MALLCRAFGCLAQNATHTKSIYSPFYKSAVRPLLQNFKTTIKTNAGQKAFSTSLQWILAGGTVLTAKVFLGFDKAFCESRVNTAVILEKKSQKSPAESQFPWLQFLKYLWPYILSLTIAIASALAVAVLNTKIGVGIGSLINVVSANLPQGNSPSDSSSFIQQIKEPAMRIIKLYVSHAIMTFSYIYSLSIVGKNVAENHGINI